MDNKTLAKDYFQRHPQSTECHISSDGRVFHQKGAAQSYASTRKNDKVDSFNRSEVEAEIPVNDPELETGAKKAPEAPATPETPETPAAPATPEAPAAPETPAADETDAPEAPATPETPETPEAPAAPETPAAEEITLENFDPASPEAYEQGKALVKKLGLKPANFKKETIYAAIAEAKTNQTKG